MSEAIIFAGSAEKNPSLYQRLRVPLGDPAAWFEIGGTRIAMVRDIERERVRKFALADRVVCPADFAPPDGLDADRETPGKPKDAERAGPGRALARPGRGAGQGEGRGGPKARALRSRT